MDRQDPSPDRAEPGAPSAPSERLIGTVVSGRYRLEAIVSEGLTGTLFRGEHTHMHKRIAVKVLHPDAASRPAVLARFEREAIAGAHVDHPNVALAKDFGTLDDGSRFLVMEYLEGTTLRQVLQQGGVSLARALHIARQIALALDAAHEKGIVHRALVPENVHLVERGGERDVVKLVDFGSAMLPPALVPVRDPSDSVATRVATPFDPLPALANYAAPEMVSGGDIDGRADLYSLGAVTYEMLTGRPFALPRGAPPSAALPHGAPAPIGALVVQLLAERREDRPSSANAVVDTLDAAAAASRRAVPANPSSPDSRLAESPGARTAFSAGQRGADLARRAATSLGRSAPSWFAELPRPIRIGIGGAFAIVGIVVLAIAFRSPTAEDALVSAAGATTGDVATSGTGKSTARGSPSSQSGDDRFDPQPEHDDRGDADAHALGDRFIREVQARRLNDAVTTLEYLAKADPKAPDDHDIREAIVRLSQRVTQVNGPAPDRYFEVVATKLGTYGPDILFELMSTKGGSDAADRASKLLKEESVRDRGTPALRVAWELATARSCEARVALLDRVKTEGDRRTLRTLLQMNECSRRSGNGDCCLRDDPRLKEAMQGLKDRGVRWQ